MKIAITGGAGFIGTQLTRKLSDEGHEILILDRHAPKDGSSNLNFAVTDLLHDLPLERYLSCDAVIHLAGVSIFNRWSRQYKKSILSSRTDTARSLIDAVRKAGRGPRVFVSASAIGYYGDGGENDLDEDASSGRDFLASVCTEWEAVAQSATSAGMRTVMVRNGIVLGPGGGMLARLLPVFKLGVGGPLGSGKQWFSWIFMEDLLNIYNQVVVDNRFSGPVNAVSPQPIRNREFTSALGRVLKRPTILPIPGLFLRLLLGELGSVVLMSQKVIPKKLLERNFAFTEPVIDGAIRRSIALT